MARATLTWTLPTTREDGAPLGQSEIAGTEITMSADGGNNFTPPAPLVPPTGSQQFIVDDLVGGDYLFRGVIVDTDGRRSGDTDVVGSVGIAPPSGITDFQVTIT